MTKGEKIRVALFIPAVLLLALVLGYIDAYLTGMLAVVCWFTTLAIMLAFAVDMIVIGVTRR